MLRSTQQDKYFQVIEWTLYFGLCGVSAIFMNGVLEKYLSRKTSFTQSERPIKELPSVLLCFSNSRNYVYGTDFRIKYQIELKDYPDQNMDLTEGENSNLFGEKVYLNKIITKYMGDCYKVTTVLTTKTINKWNTEFLFYFNDSIKKEDLPSLRIFFTSENNVYGTAIGWTWFPDGKMKKIILEQGSFLQIELTQEYYSYLTDDIYKCSYQSYYDCLGRSVAAKLEGSSSQCSMFSFPPLSICKTNKTVEEENEFEMTISEFMEECAHKLCMTLDYSGDSYRSKFLEHSHKNASNGFSYLISSNSSTLYEEYLIYDAISMISSVGGTLGMCIGFSFTSIISSLMNILQQGIMFIKIKFSNQRRLKSQNGSLNKMIETDITHLGEDFNKCNSEKNPKDYALNTRVMNLEKQFAEICMKLKTMEMKKNI